MPDPSVKALLNDVTTAVLSPGYEGANIGSYIGFKHVNYLIEKAVIEHFGACGLPVGALYDRHSAGFDIVEIDSRLSAPVHIDDRASIEIKPVTKEGATELAFRATLTVERDGERRKAVTSKVRAVLRRDGNPLRVTSTDPLPEGLEQFVVERIGASRPQAAAPAVTGQPLISGGSSEAAGDPVLEQLLAGRNAYGWKFRIPYSYVHWFERIQMSGYLRLMEEAKHRFVDSRGISIRTLLFDRNWIPVVTQSKLTMLDEALMEEDLYLVYEVEDIVKDLLYTSRLDAYAVRDGHLVPTATGTITHGYGVVENGSQGHMVSFDDEVLRAFRNEPGQ